MFFQIVLFVWQFMLDLVAVLGMADDEKELEITLLRQQLRIVERNQERGPQIPRWQKVPLAALAVRLKDKASNARAALKESVRLFKPTRLSAGIERLCDGNGLISRDENQDGQRLMPNLSAGSCEWRKTIRA